MNKNQNSDCIHEINLAVFEEVCCVHEVKEKIIKKDYNYKKVINYYINFSPIKAEIIEREVYIEEMVDFIWDNICQRTILRRIMKKKEIIEDWNSQIKSQVSGIIRDDFWSQIQDYNYPESEIQDRKLIRKKQKLEKDREEQMYVYNQNGSLSEEDLEKLLDTNRKLSQIKSLILSLGTGSRDGEDDEEIENTYHTQTQDGIFLSEEMIGHLSSPDKIFFNEERNTILKSVLNIKLTKKQNTVIHLYFFENLTLKEIGYILDLTESRISQILIEAIMKLKKSKELKEFDESIS